MLREAGAREVHVRISSPPNRWPCYYGIDTPTRSELIASNCTIEQTRDFLQADSLSYLSLDGLVTAVTEASTKRRLPLIDGAAGGYCHACFSGDYAVPPAKRRTPT